MKYWAVLVLLCAAAGAQGKDANEVLHDVHTAGQMKAATGEQYMLCLGDDVAGKAEGGTPILLSAGPVTACTDSSIAISYEDGSVRDWSISSRTIICDVREELLDASSLAVGDTATVVWFGYVYEGRPDHGGRALAVQPGAMRRLFMDASGKINLNLNTEMEFPCGKHLLGD